MVGSYLKMVMNIKANLLMVNFKGPEDLNRINMSIMDNLKMDSMMGKVNIYGCRDQFIMVNEKGEKHGYGVYKKVDGSRYEGSWFKGKCHGKGY